jgi:uncharacterized glyoxalase superfamily protein PhnB
MTGLTGLEVCFCVPGTLLAIDLYGRVFGAETIEKTALAKGLNEAEITVMENRGLRTAMVKDPFGYAWQLHQIDKDV